MNRRALLRLLCAAPALAQEPHPLNLIVRSANPEDFEMPLDGFRTWITPAERFFVRTHLFRPTVEPGTWRLRVGGEVANPLSLGMAALRQLPRAELTGVLECAGNGRGLFQPRMPGVPWRYGAVGNARWSGVRLADVLKRAGLKPGARHIALNGADVPMGNVPDFVRSLPVEKALHPDTLLAFEMNGAPLPASHGFPLRLVAPGWAGDSWVKWVTDIQALEHEYDGFFMKTAYRRPVAPVAPGTAVDPSRMTPVTSIKVKSVIAAPADGDVLDAGPVTIQGAAWSGETPVARVEVSTDNGRTWTAARLGRDRARYAWRLWEHRWTPAKGPYVLMARATDESGAVQPVTAEWNPSGYLHNGIHRIGVEVGQARPRRRQGPPPAPAFPQPAKSSCLGCHGGDIISGQRLTRAQWEREVDKMVRWGAPVKPGDREGILKFLSEQLGPGDSAP